MAARPTISPAWTSSSSTNSATCPLPSPAGSSCSIWSAASTSRPRSSSPPTSPSASPEPQPRLWSLRDRIDSFAVDGRACSATPRGPTPSWTGSRAIATSSRPVTRAGASEIARDPPVSRAARLPDLGRLLTAAASLTEPAPAAPAGRAGTFRAVRSPACLERARSRRGSLLCTTGTTSIGVNVEGCLTVSQAPMTPTVGRRVIPAQTNARSSTCHRTGDRDGR